MNYRSRPTRKREKEGKNRPTFQFSAKPRNIGPIVRAESSSSRPFSFHSVTLLSFPLARQIKALIPASSIFSCLKLQPSSCCSFTAGPCKSLSFTHEILFSISFLFLFLSKQLLYSEVQNYVERTRSMYRKVG